MQGGGGGKRLTATGPFGIMDVAGKGGSRQCRLLFDMLIVGQWERDSGLRPPESRRLPQILDRRRRSAFSPYPGRFPRLPQAFSACLDGFSCTKYRFFCYRLILLFPVPQSGKMLKRPCSGRKNWGICRNLEEKSSKSAIDSSVWKCYNSVTICNYLKGVSAHGEWTEGGRPDV